MNNPHPDEQLSPSSPPILLPRNPRQLRNGRRLILPINVAIQIHRQANIAMAGQGLYRLGRDFCLAEIGDERVPVGVEVGETVVGILVSEEVAVLSTVLFLGVINFRDPCLSSGG